MSLYIYRVSRKRTKRTRRKTNEFSTCFSYACYFNWRSRRSFLQINSQRKQRKNISTKNSQIIIVVISHNWFTSIKINEFSEKITRSRTNSASRDNWGGEESGVSLRTCSNESMTVPVRARWHIFPCADMCQGR